MASMPTNTSHGGDRPASTLKGAVLAGSGVTVKEIAYDTGNVFDSKAIIQTATTLRLSVGSSGSCSVNFTGASLKAGIITLQAREGVTSDKICTLDYRMHSFILTVKDATAVKSVKLIYSSERKVSIPVLQSVNEGTTLDRGTLVWNNYKLRELTPKETAMAPAAKILYGIQGRSAVESSNKKTIVFTYGGSSSCPVNFVSLNAYADELQLVSKAGATGDICTADFQTRAFKITSTKPITATKIVVQSEEYLDQTTVIPVTSAN